MTAKLAKKGDPYMQQTKHRFDAHLTEKVMRRNGYASLFWRSCSAARRRV